MKDPVCQMEIGETKFRSTYRGKTYYFCSALCKGKFDKNPEEYAKG